MIRVKKRKIFSIIIKKKLKKNLLKKIKKIFKIILIKKD
jgi:hypothetical protein